MRLIILLILFSKTLVFGQKLIPEIRKEFYSKEENRLQNGIKLRDFYLDESPDSIYNIGSFLINQGIKFENMSWLNFGKLIISSYYTKKGKAEISIENLKSCMIYYEKKRDYEMLADAQNLMGVASLYQLKNKEAINWFIKSLENSEKLEAENQSYMAQINMADAFVRLKAYESAEKETFSFMEKVKKQKLNKGLRRAYDMLAKICFATNRAEEGGEFYKKSFELAYENGDKLGLSFATNNMAIAHFEKGNLDKTRSFFEKALSLRKELNNPALICESYFNLGEYYFAIEKYNDAIQYYNFSKKLAEKFNLLSENSDATQRLAACLEMKGDFKTAYQISVEFGNLQSDILLKMKQDDSEINEKYRELRDNEKKLKQKIRENQLQKRIQKSQRLNLIVFVLVGFLFLLIIVLNSTKNNQT
jgi:tetratricopeptide (TPR) repeat protein